MMFGGGRLLRTRMPSHGETPIVNVSKVSYAYSAQQKLPRVSQAEQSINIHPPLRNSGGSNGSKPLESSISDEKTRITQVDWTYSPQSIKIRDASECGGVNQVVMLCRQFIVMQMRTDSASLGF